MRDAGLVSEDASSVEARQRLEGRCRGRGRHVEIDEIDADELEMMATSMTT